MVCALDYPCNGDTKLFKRHTYVSTLVEGKGWLNVKKNQTLNVIGQVFSEITRSSAQWRVLCTKITRDNISSAIFVTLNIHAFYLYINLFSLN